MRLTRVVLLLVSITALSPASALAAHDLTISTAADSGLTVTAAAGTTTVAAGSDDANLSVTSLVGYLNAGNLVVNTGSDGCRGPRRRHGRPRRQHPRDRTDLRPEARSESPRSDQRGPGLVFGADRRLRRSPGRPAGHARAARRGRPDQWPAQRSGVRADL